MYRVQVIGSWGFRVPDFQMSALRLLKRCAFLCLCCVEGLFLCVVGLVLRHLGFPRQQSHPQQRTGLHVGPYEYVDMVGQRSLVVEVSGVLPVFS